MRFSKGGNNDELEDFGNHTRRILLLSPATPKRREQLQKLSFQRLFETAESYQQWFGIDVLKGTSQDDRVFLRKMFHRRHILMHNGGKVDDDYLQNSGDATVRMHERIRIRSNEANRLIQLIGVISENLLAGFESMT